MGIEDVKAWIFDSLPESGQGKGNASLRKDFKHRFPELEESAFWEEREKLVLEGKAGKGKGKGGSTYRLVERPKAKSEAAEFKLEKELYGPFENYLGKTWSRDNSINRSIIQITANQGAKSTGGKWTRPDLCVVAINKYEFLPGTQLELITFELKTSSNWDVDSVFETASHSVYAHKSYLAIHLPSGWPSPITEEFERLEKLCGNFGIGLIIIGNPQDPDDYEVRLDPERKNPDPYELNAFLSSQLSADNKTKLITEQK